MDSRGIISVDLTFASLVFLIMLAGVLSLASERTNTVSTMEKLGIL